MCGNGQFIHIVFLNNIHLSGILCSYAAHTYILLLFENGGSEIKAAFLFFVHFEWHYERLMCGRRYLLLLYKRASLI